MSQYKCNPCDCPDEHYRDSMAWRKAMITLLCDVETAVINGGGGGATLWDRVGTILSPHTAGDSVDLGTGSLLATNLTASAMLPGSVLFAGTAGIISQDNVNFLFNAVSKLFTLGGSQNFITPSSEIVFGAGVDQFETYTIRANSVVNKDKTTLIINSAGALSNGRGAYIQLKGENTASSGGSMILNASGDMFLQCVDPNSIFFNTNNLRKWEIPTGAATAVDLIYGPSATASVVATIRSGRADGSDDATLVLTSGGAAGTTRGAGITLVGNDVGGAGAGGGITFEAGTGTTAYNTFNQPVGIGSAPNANAQLDVSSTTKAFMPPRMTTAQKNAVASPAAGMVVYDTNLNKLCVYNGSAWTVADGYGKIIFGIGDGVNAIGTGIKKAIEVTQNCTITGWKVLSDDPSTTAGAIVIDIWKLAYTTSYPPLVANTIINTGAGGVKPTITATNTSGASANVNNWTVALSAGDILRFNVDSVASLTSVTLILEVTLN